jgi:hypothetical protein
MRPNVTFICALSALFCAFVKRNPVSKEMGIPIRRDFGVYIQGHIHELMPIEAMPSTALRKQTAARVGLCWIQQYGSRNHNHSEQYVLPRLWVLLLAL